VVASPVPPPVPATRIENLPSMFIPPFPSATSWHGAWLSTGTLLPFTFYLSFLNSRLLFPLIV
jgi:hypothetical protein